MKRRSDRQRSCNTHAPESSRLLRYTGNPGQRSRFALLVSPQGVSCLTTQVSSCDVDLSLPKGRSGRKRPCKGPQANELEKGLFPGRISPGLIEAGCSAAASLDRARDFPGESARASLKPAPARYASRRRCDFPGESARASLKREVEPERVHADADFPGESARASLKRRSSGPWSRRSGRYFPGESARASLKLVEAELDGEPI